MRSKSKVYEYRFKTSVLKKKLLEAEERASQFEEQLAKNQVTLKEVLGQSQVESDKSR